MGVKHICLKVGYLEETTKLYMNELDFEESWSFETEDGQTVNQSIADENRLKLQFSTTESGTEFDEGTAWDHLAIETNDVNAAVGQIDHYGTVQEPQDQPAASARTAFIKNPDGHTIELIELFKK